MSSAVDQLRAEQALAGIADPNSQSLHRVLRDRVVLAGIVLLGVLLVVALLGPLLLLSPDDIDAAAVLRGPSAGHLLGTDPFGRDLFSRLAAGLRTSLLLAAISVAVAAVAGVPIGLLAGMRGGWVDAVLMRILDALLAFPVLLLSLFVVAALGPNAFHLAIAIAFVFLPYFARLTRSEARVLRSAAFVEASQCYGATPARTMFAVIMPNAFGPIAVQLSLSMGFAVLAEAGLSFLGLGVQPPDAALGLMLKDSQAYLQTFPWYSIVTGATIVLLVLSFVLLGDGLRDVLAPRGREERA